MLEVTFINGTTLRIACSKPRLCDLTVYNGCPHISIHYITNKDLDTLINALMREEYRRQVEADANKS